METTVSSYHIFQTASCRILQADESEQLVFELGQEKFVFKLCELVRFRNRVFAIDIVSMIAGEKSDVELIYIAHLDRFLVLSLMEILELRELLSGTFTMLELNSIITRKLYSPL